MRTTIRIVFLTFAVWTAGCAPGEEGLRPDESIVAITEVNVLPMDSERVLEDQTVVITGDRITQVGQSGTVEVPENALEIDGRDKYLMPGIGEMHGHIPSPEESAEYVESILFLYVSNGVTTVRGMQGRANQLELRDRVNEGTLLGPSLYLAGPGFSGNSIDSPEQATERVKEQKQQGWDLLKVLPGLTLEEYDAMAQTAHEVDIPFAGHVPEEVGLVHALQMGQQTIDHLDGYIRYLEGESGPLDEQQLAEAVKLTKESGAWVVPTMVLWETIIGAADLERLRSYPELKYMPPQEVQNWVERYERRIGDPEYDEFRAQQIAANRNRLLKALFAGGVPVLFGTDSPQQFSVPGFSIHRELAHMAEVGLSAHEILRSATRNVGEYLKAEDSFGTVQEGSRADLILLDANPLQDVSNVKRRAGVILRGTWLSEDEIQSRLERIAASYEQTR